GQRGVRGPAALVPQLGERPPRLVGAPQFEERVGDPGTRVDHNVTAVLGGLLIALERDLRPSGQAPLLRGEHEDGRPRHLAGLVLPGERVEPPGEGVVIALEQGLVEQPVELLTGHVCHRPRLRALNRFCRDNPRHWHGYVSHKLNHTTCPLVTYRAYCPHVSRSRRSRMPCQGG